MNVTSVKKLAHLVLRESDFEVTVHSYRYHTQQKLSRASSFPIKVALLTDINLIVR